MMIYHAAALRRAGFAALMLDLRAHGESGGEASTGGWLERDDLQTVIDALGQREDIDRDRIGVLGISLGAKVALLAAARAPDLRAVAAEGASPITLSDYRSRPHNLWRWIGYPLIALSMQVKSWMSGAHPDTSLHQAVQALASRPLLLISCGQGTEKTWTEYLSQVASGPTRHWNIPFAHHAAGYFEEPEGYEEQMAEFFRRALVNDLEAV
jgi:pimeloyl-ACP methyl ester carboxylesterase